MSTSGHYTRYINQYPGWSDNCDTMYRAIHSPLEGECRFCKNNDNCRHDHKYCYDEIAHLQVEHTSGNKTAYCALCFDNPGYSPWLWFKEGYNGPLTSGGHIHIIEYEGNRAIQHVLETVTSFEKSVMIDLMFRHNFNMYSYMDYFRMFQEVVS